MKRHEEKEIVKIRELRKSKRYSFAQIGRMTNIPSTTIRNWCMDIAVGTKWDTLLATNKRKRQELLTAEAGIVEGVDIKSTENAKFLAALLYWCEGSKYPSSTAVTMVNSDPDLMKSFVRLLRNAFKLDESKFHVHLQIHTTHDFIKVRKFWSELLQVPASQFMKPTVTKPNGRKHRSQYFGTCTLKYQDYRLLLKLMGIYEAFARRFGEVA
jgi:hypothetical protein